MAVHRVHERTAFEQHRACMVGDDRHNGDCTQAVHAVEMARLRNAAWNIA